MSDNFILGLIRGDSNCYDMSQFQKTVQWVFNRKLGPPRWAQNCMPGCVCARGHMPGAICPEAYALGYMPGAIGPGPYARGHVHGAKTITCAVYGGTGAKTSVCVAFGYSTVLVPFLRFRHVLSNITLAHIWRTERATWPLECIFTGVS